MTRPRLHQHSSRKYAASSLNFDLKVMHFFVNDVKLRAELSDLKISETAGSAPSSHKITEALLPISQKSPDHPASHWHWKDSLSSTHCPLLQSIPVQGFPTSDSGKTCYSKNRTWLSYMFYLIQHIKSKRNNLRQSLTHYILFDVKMNREIILYSLNLVFFYVQFNKTQNKTSIVT